MKMELQFKSRSTGWVSVWGTATAARAKRIENRTETNIFEYMMEGCFKRIVEIIWKASVYILHFKRFFFRGGTKPMQLRIRCRYPFWGHEEAALARAALISRPITWNLNSDVQIVEPVLLLLPRSTEMPGAIISPSVLASDFGQLTAECKRMIIGGAHWLHMGKNDPSYSSQSGYLTRL